MKNNVKQFIRNVEDVQNTSQYFKGWIFVFVEIGRIPPKSMEVSKFTPAERICPQFSSVFMVFPAQKQRVKNKTLQCY